MMPKYIYGLLIVCLSTFLSSSVSAAQIYTDVLPNSTVNLSYVSGGQLGSMSITNHSSLRQFVPYSDTNGIAYTCSPASWLSHLSNPIGQPVMRGASNRGLTVSCATQCGPLMRGTAYGDEPNNEYCADGSLRTFISTTGNSDKLQWTCGSSPTQCRAYKGCMIRGGSVGTDPLASTTPTNGGGDVTQIKLGHNKAIQFGNRSSGPYGDEGMVRCQGGQLYPHMSGTAVACGTPLGISFSFGPYSQNISLANYHWNSTTNRSPEYILNMANAGVAVFSVQSSAAYCDINGCPASWANDPYDNADWVYGPTPLVTQGTCPYSGQLINF